MVEEPSAGGLSINLGALLLTLSFVSALLTYFGFLPDRTWFEISWLTTYSICAGGILLGLFLLLHGLHLRRVLAGYTRAFEREMMAAERSIRALRRVSGKLGDRTKRLKQIERLARTSRAGYSLAFSGGAVKLRKPGFGS